MGGRDRLRFAIALAGLAALLPVGSASAATFTFTDNTPIKSLPVNGAATPYPTKIPVSGITDVTDVNATLRGVTAAQPANLDVMLGSPGGQASVLMSDAPSSTPGCNTAVSGLNLAFDDEAGGQLPAFTVLVSGSYRPTDIDANGPPGCGSNTMRPDNYGPSAPNEPANAPLSVFDGTNPNGDWNLFVVDDFDNIGNDASIAGWTLQITNSAKFDLGKVKKNKRRGTASITVDVPGPGTLSLGGAGVKAQRQRSGERITAAREVTEAGSVTLSVKPTAKKKKKLKSTGKAKVQVKVIYTPAGGTADTETQPVNLVTK